MLNVHEQQLLMLLLMMQPEADEAGRRLVDGRQVGAASRSRRGSGSRNLLERRSSGAARGSAEDVGLRPLRSTSWNR